MTMGEMEARQSEVDAFADWLAENGEREYVQYAHHGEVSWTSYQVRIY